MEEYYSKAVKLSEKFDNENLSFFLSHLTVSQLLIRDENGIKLSLVRAEKMKDRSFGLLKIVQALYLKSKRDAEWNVMYQKGRKEAEETGYIENIELC